MITIEFAPILGYGWLFIGVSLLIHDIYYHYTQKKDKFKFWRIHHGYIGAFLIILGAYLLYLFYLAT